jgi:hypothetical protein
MRLHRASSDFSSKVYITGFKRLHETSRSNLRCFRHGTEKSSGPSRLSRWKISTLLLNFVLLLIHDALSDDQFVLYLVLPITDDGVTSPGLATAFNRFRLHSLRKARIFTSHSIKLTQLFSASKLLHECENFSSFLPAVINIFEEKFEFHIIESFNMHWQWVEVMLLYNKWP